MTRPLRSTRTRHPPRTSRAAGPRWRPRLGAWIAAALALTAGCRDHVLSVVETGRVEISGAPADPVPAGDTLQLRAVARSAGGVELSGREAFWSSSDTAVVRVEAGGMAVTRAPGTAVVSVRIEGRRADAPIVVAPAPRLLVDGFALRATRGSIVEDSAVVSLEGVGRARGLDVAISHPAGSPTGWLEATLRETVTPTRLVVRADASTLAAGRHAAVVTVRSAAGAEVAVPVELDVVSGLARWTVERQATTGGTLSGLWVASPNRVFVAGGDGVLHFDGARLGAPWDTGPAVTGIWGASERDVHAVIDGGVYHFDGRGWARGETPDQAHLLAVWGASSTDVFAVGLFGTIARFDGVRWTVVRGRDFAEPVLYGVGGAGPDHVFAVGSGGAILRFDGTAWTGMASGTSASLRAVWAASPTDLFAVGDSGTVLRFDGTGWRPIASGTTEHLTDVWGTSPTDVYAVGSRGTLLHFDGSRWTTLPSGTRAALLAIRGVGPGELIAVGTAGTIVRVAGGRGTVVESGAALHGVWGTAESVFAVGALGLALQRGPGAWRVLDTGTDATLYGVWASSDRDVFAVGAGGTILRYDGSTWRPMASGTGRTLRAVRGVSSSEVYAVGADGTVLRFDGTRWSELPATGLPIPGRRGELTDVYPTGSGGLVVAGYYVTGVFRNFVEVHTVVARFDGVAWTAEVLRVDSGDEFVGGYDRQGVWTAPDGATFVASYRSAFRNDGTGWTRWWPASALRGVWASSGSDAYAVGSAITHFDGVAWRPVADPARHVLNRVWGRSATEVWAVGEGMTIVRGQP
jgi:hypothetical protein